MQSIKSNKTEINGYLFLFRAVIILTSIIFLGILISSIKKQDNNSIYFGAIMFTVYAWGLYLLCESIGIFKNISRINSKTKDINTIKDLSLAIKGFEPLETNFKAYKKSLRPIKDTVNIGDTKYYATVNVDSFINEETIIYSTLNIRTINCLATSLTGIGIFGTFYGLITGLEGLNSNEIQSGIGVLLDGVNTSFTTSLLGIILSISLTFLVKYTIDSISREIYKLVNIINSIVETSSSVEGFKELENQLILQTTSIQKLATDLSEHISKQFTSSLNETLTPLFENLESSMSSLANLNKETFSKFSQTSSETIAEMINSSSDLFNNNISQEMNLLKESLSLISEKNTELVNNMNESIIKMEGLAKVQEDAMTNISESANNIKEMYEMFGDINSTLVENLNMLNIYVENYSKIQEAQDLSMENMKKILDNSTDIIENQKEISQNTIKVQEDISNNLNDAVAQYDKLIEIQGEYIDSYSDINEDIVESIESLNDKSDLIDSYIDRQLDILQEVNSSSENILSNLNSSSDLIQYVNVTLDSLHSSNIKLSSITNNMSELSSLVEKIATLDEVFNNCADNLNKISQTIDVGIKEYEKSLDDSTCRVLKRYDSEVSKCIDSLFEITKHLDSITINIEESTSQIATNLKDFKDIIIIEDEDIVNE